MDNPIGNIGGGTCNPLGPLGELIGGIAEGVGKLLQGPDMSSIGAVGKALLDKVGTFDPAGQTQGSAAESKQEAATTEFVPPADPGHAQAGYAVASQVGRSSDSAAPQRAQSASAATAQTSIAPSQTEAPADPSPVDPRQQSSSAATAEIVTASGCDASTAATAQEAKNREEADVMKVVLANFQDFDSQGWRIKDGVFDAANLRSVAGDSYFSPEVRRAARYLLSHPDLMTNLEVMTGRGDSTVSVGAVSAYTVRLLSAPAQGQVATPPANTQVSAPPPGSNPVLTDDSCPPPRADPCEQAGTLDDRLAQMGTSLEDKQNQLINLFNKDPKDLTEADKRLMNTLPIEIQKATHQYEQMHDIVSNLMKTFNDVSMNAIRHIG